MASHLTVKKQETEDAGEAILFRSSFRHLHQLPQIYQDNYEFTTKPNIHCI